MKIYLIKCQHLVCLYYCIVYSLAAELNFQMIKKCRSIIARNDLKGFLVNLWQLRISLWPPFFTNFLLARSRLDKTVNCFPVFILNFKQNSFQCMIATKKEVSNSVKNWLLRNPINKTSVFLKQTLQMW